MEALQTPIRASASAKESSALSAAETKAEARETVAATGGRKLEDQDAEEEVDLTNNDDDVYSIQPFENGISEYDEYQQAWRFLGYMIDCHAGSDDDDWNGRRDLGSGDDVTGEGCARYVLWAAYVDLEYEGGGISEYQFYDTINKQWDDTACTYANNGNGGGRCAKMDCHLSNTKMSLLGFFKHRSYDDWMEQLFKHEGVCVWGQEKYAFMDGAREAWPQGCTDSGSYQSDGEPIYYDIKPTQGGGMTVGLYTDTQCIEEYEPEANDSITPENIMGAFLSNGGGGSNDNYNYDFSQFSFEEGLNYWEESMGQFKVCQPCVAYNLKNVYGAYDDDGNDMYGGDNFDCNDDAGYQNVNQCMKFMAKTYMNTATFRDLSLARSQGTLVDTPLAGFAGSNSRRIKYIQYAFMSFLNYVFLVVAIGVLIYGIVSFWRARAKVKRTPDMEDARKNLVFA